jgi:hypothetical protein
VRNPDIDPNDPAITTESGIPPIVRTKKPMRGAEGRYHSIILMPPNHLKWWMIGCQLGASVALFAPQGNLWGMLGCFLIMEAASIVGQMVYRALFVMTQLQVAMSMRSEQAAANVMDVMERFRAPAE